MPSSGGSGKAGKDLFTIPVKTQAQVQWLDITRQVQLRVNESGVQEGMVNLLCLHTTAGLTINENADPDVVADIIRQLDRMVPQQGEYRHAEGNSAAHIKSSLVGASITVPLSQGRLLLGTWQGIYFCEFDGPRDRQVAVRIMGR